MIQRDLSRFLMLFSPAELATGAFFLFLTPLIVAFPDDGAIRPFYAANIGILVAIIIVAHAAKRWPDCRPLFHFRNWYLAFVMTVPYRELSILIPQMQPIDIDEVLIRMDYFIFNVHPTVFLERFEVPILTDVFQVVYCSYYFLPIILGIVIYSRRDMRNFIHFFFAVIFSIYVTYVGYMIFPAVGPRFSLFHLQTTALVGCYVTIPIREYLNWLEHIMRDAFPSGHTMLPLVVLFYTWRYEKRLLVPFIPVTALIIISTIYLRYHYAVDVMAGIILAFPSIVAAEVAMEWWERMQKLYRRYPDKTLLQSLYSGD